MPKQRYQRREPTHDWQQIRPLLKDSTQITYEIIRPVILWGVTPKERAAETGMSQRTIYYKSNLFDQAGMASLTAPELPPPIPKLDKRTLPPPMRQTIVDLKAEYPALSLHELASICYAQFGRKPSPHTIKLILASGPKPSRTTRRYPRFSEIDDPVERASRLLFVCTLKAGPHRALPDTWRQVGQLCIQPSNAGLKNSLLDCKTSRMPPNRVCERLICMQ